MNSSALFLLGFAAASVLWTALIIGYYLRARRRVMAIKQGIARYQAASKMVGEALDRVKP